MHYLRAHPQKKHKSFKSSCYGRIRVTSHWRQGSICSSARDAYALEMTCSLECRQRILTLYVVSLSWIMILQVLWWWVLSRSLYDRNHLRDLSHLRFSLRTFVLSVDRRSPHLICTILRILSWIRSLSSFIVFILSLLAMSRTLSQFVNLFLILSTFSPFMSRACGHILLYVTSVFICFRFKILISPSLGINSVVCWTLLRVFDVWSSWLCFTSSQLVWLHFVLDPLCFPSSLNLPSIRFLLSFLRILFSLLFFNFLLHLSYW